MAVTWGLGGAARRASRYRGVMTFSVFARTAGHVSAVITAITGPALLQNHFNQAVYLIGWTNILQTGQGWL
jgi:hypothetical protein